MKYLLFLLAAFAAWAQPAQIQISDILYRADGTRFNGRIIIRWQTVDQNGARIPGGTKTIRVANGVVNTTLAPSTDATPNTTTYDVTYDLDLGEDRRVSWTIPSSGPVTIADIEGPASTTTPAPSVAASTITGILDVEHGGSGVGTLTGIIKGNGTSDFSAATATDLLSLSGWPAGLDLTELGYVNGVTSALQAQLDAKQAADADLDTWATVTSSANGRSLVSAADYAAMRTLLTVPDISGTPTMGNCVEWVSATQIGDAGDPCGTGAGSVTPESLTDASVGVCDSMDANDYDCDTAGGETPASGDTFWIDPDIDATQPAMGPLTLDINGVAADLLYPDGTDTGAGSLCDGKRAQVWHDGTNWVKIGGEECGPYQSTVSEAEETDIATPAAGFGTEFFDDDQLRMVTKNENGDLFGGVQDKDCDALNPGDVVSSIAGGVPGCSTPAGGSGTDLLDLTTRTIREDFCAPNGVVGTNTRGVFFQHAANGSGASNVGLSSTGTRRCGIRLSTSTGSTDLVRIYGYDSIMAINPTTETFDLRWRVQAISATTDVFMSFGLIRTSSSDEICNVSVTGNTNCLAFVFKPATNANWLLSHCSASSCNQEDSGVAVATSTTYLLRIWSTSAGTIRWSINGTEETPFSTTVPNTLLGPGSNLSNTTTSARQFDITGFVQETLAQ